MVFNIDNWIIGPTIISGNEGSCDAAVISNDWKVFDGRPTKGHLDYAVCGCKHGGSGSGCDDDDGKEGLCKQLTWESWDAIWDGCMDEGGRASTDPLYGKNWDKCSNMPPDNKKEKTIIRIMKSIN